MHTRGFTLIELLVAISILAILMGLSYAGLNSVIVSHQRISAQQINFKQFNHTFTHLRSELQHIVPRPVSDAYGTRLAALSLNYSNGITLSFTRLGRPNPSGLQRSSLQRISYFIDENQLKKRIWLSPDSADMSLFSQENLIKNIEILKISVLGDDKNWHNTWPPQQDMPLTLLPKAIKISITRKNQDEFIQLIELPR